MRILLINHYAGSPELGMEFRPYYLAREWEKLGHDVTILAATYSHLRRAMPEVTSEAHVQHLSQRIRYIWLRTPRYGGAIRRIINILTFLFKLHLRARRLARTYTPDIVIASSTYPLDIYPARRIARIAGARLVYEVHDLWPLSPMVIGGYSKHHPYILLIQRAENYAYRHVDKVISLLWNAESHMREHGLAPGKFACIPNGFDPEEWRPEALQPIPKEQEETLAALRAQGKRIVLFAGGHLRSSGAWILLEAAILMRENQSIDFLFVGNGPDREAMIRHSRERHCESIHFFPALPKRQLFSLLQRVDLGLVGGVKSPIYRFGTSQNKRIDYMMAALPFVASIEEYGAEWERIQCGVRVPAEDPDALAQAIRDIIDLPDDQRVAMGKRGREYALANHPYPILAERMIREIVEGN